MSFIEYKKWNFCFPIFSYYEKDEKNIKILGCTYNICHNFCCAPIRSNEEKIKSKKELECGEECSICCAIYFLTPFTMTLGAVPCIFGLLYDIPAYCINCCPTKDMIVGNTV